MRPNTKLFSSLFAACALFAGTASATTHTFTINLDQAQAGTSGSASGSGTATYDDETGYFSWSYSYSGLSGMPLAAHFHGPAAPGGSAGIRVNVVDSSGTMVFDNPNSGMVPISGAFGQELINGLWYLNIHTSMYMDGEIRGQLINDNPTVDNSAAIAAINKKIKRVRKKEKAARKNGKKAKARRLSKKLKKLFQTLTVLNNSIR